MPEPHSDALILFGATGDLAYKQIFPALHAMTRRGHLNIPVIGVARGNWTIEQLRARARAIGQHPCEVLREPQQRVVAAVQCQRIQRIADPPAQLLDRAALRSGAAQIRVLDRRADAQEHAVPEALALAVHQPRRHELHRLRGRERDAGRTGLERREVATSYVRTVTHDNWKQLRETDEDARARRHAELRALAADPVAMRTYLLRTSMIDSLRGAVEPA